jgi:hypothetical protein
LNAFDLGPIFIVFLNGRGDAGSGRNVAAVARGGCRKKVQRETIINVKLWRVVGAERKYSVKPSLT